MTTRQFVSPVLVRNGTATVLHHIPFGKRAFKEADLQALLFAHPTLIPVGDIEPIFDGLRPLARELRVGSGFIDLVFMNDEGYLALVETKLKVRCGAKGASNRTPRVATTKMSFSSRNARCGPSS